MTRFSDELLSAYLDGEATADEQAAVEARLAASEADRQLLTELQALRGEFQSLPKTAVAAGFTDRVVRAAVAARSREAATVSPAGATPSRRSFQWTYWAAAVALSLAAFALLVAQNWRRDNSNLVNGPGESHPAQPQEPTLAERLIADLRLAAPRQGEAAVLRLRVPKNAPLGQLLDFSFAEAGLAQRPAFDTESGAIQFGAAFRQQLQDKAAEELVEVSNALYVEASLQQIEQALRAMAADNQRQLSLVVETRLALAERPRPRVGEGEAGSENIGQAFCQVLNAGMFRLQKQAAEVVAPSAPPATIDLNRPVRILILVEQFE